GAYATRYLKITIKSKHLIKKTLFLLLFILQLIVFWDNIGIFQWGKIKVHGLACTCPDVSVDKGIIYLKSIVPDSLQQYNLECSEVYLDERPSTSIDPMGIEQYIIKGEIIGKRRVNKNDVWHPYLAVNEWYYIDNIKDTAIKLLILGQLILLLIIFSKRKTNIETIS
ncbi:MAG: hypothetical protein KAI79_15880, partial [Bacteroidales bacterium]|nr:hypothetical protein [Bacteroidales bacterium]